MAEMMKDRMTPYSTMSIPDDGATGKDDIKSEAKEVVTKVASQAGSVASEVATQARDFVASGVSQQQQRSAGDLENVANALRSSTQKLEGNMALPYVEKAADGIQAASEYLRTANVQQVKSSVESFARREPLLFLGGAFALGIVAARFLKSSSSHPQDNGERPDGRALSAVSDPDGPRMDSPATPAPSASSELARTTLSGTGGL